MKNNNCGRPTPYLEHIRSTQGKNNYKVIIQDHANKMNSVASELKLSKYTEIPKCFLEKKRSRVIQSAKILGVKP